MDSMPPQSNDVSHGDILLQIGQLQGQMKTLITLIGQKREDINTCFNRLGALEKGSATREELATESTKIGFIKEQQARWAGACLLAAFIVPIAVTFLTGAFKVQMRLGDTPAPHAPLTHSGQVAPRP
jgi:hypothetical protein